MRLPHIFFATASSLALFSGLSAQTFNATSGTSSWNVAGSWTPSGFPNAVGASASFNSITAAQTVNLSAAITVGTLNFSNNGNFVLTLANGTGGSLVFDATGSGEAAVNVSGTSTTTNNITISASTTLNDTLRFTNNNVSGTGAATTTMTGTITGSGGFIKDGPGRFSFSTVAKTYTGATVVEEGRLRFTATGAATGTSSITVQSGGMLMLDSNSGAFSFGSAAITLNGPGTAEASQNAGALRNNGSGTSTLANAVALASNSTLHVEGGSSSFQLNGALSGGFVLSKVGGGNLILNNANSGITTSHTVVNGTVTVNASSQLGTGALSLAQSATNTTTVTLNNAAQTVSGLSTTWTDTTGTLAQTLNLNGTALTVNQNTNSTFGDGAVSTLTGVIAGTGSLIKSGTGTLTLTGTNSYSGGTTLSAGTLVAGSTGAFGSGNITVATGATLDLGSFAVGNTITNNGILARSGGTVTGTVAGTNVLTGSVAGTPTFTGTLKGTATFTGAVVVDGTHAPGNSPGIQAFAAGLSYGASSILEWEFVGDALAVRGTDFDGVNVTGGALSITLGASLKLLASGINYAATDWDILRTFTIVDNSGAGITTGDFTLDTSSALGFAGQGTWSVLTAQGTGGDTVLTWTPVPEPSTYAALAGLAVLGFAACRRRVRA